MTLRSVTARFECDTCGAEQQVYMDPALEINGGSLSEAAVHCAREDILDVEIDDQDRFTCGACLRVRDDDDD